MLNAMLEPFKNKNKTVYGQRYAFYSYLIFERQT